MLQYYLLAPLLYAEEAAPASEENVVVEVPAAEEEAAAPAEEAVEEAAAPVEVVAEMEPEEVPAAKEAVAEEAPAEVAVEAPIEEVTAEAPVEVEVAAEAPVEVEVAAEEAAPAAKAAEEEPAVEEAPVVVVDEAMDNSVVAAGNGTDEELAPFALGTMQPLPEITTARPLRPSVDLSQHTATTFFVNVTEPRHFGTYFCRVRNAVGANTIKYVVTEDLTPTTPEPTDPPVTEAPVEKEEEEGGEKKGLGGNSSSMMRPCLCGVVLATLASLLLR